MHKCNYDFSTKDISIDNSRLSEALAKSRNGLIMDIAIKTLTNNR